MSLLEKYILFRSNQANDSQSDCYFCQIEDISLEELNEAKATSEKLWRRIVDKRREQYSERMLEIDNALFLAAQSGDCKAADLLYRRFDGWSPKLVEQNNTIFNFAELARKANPKNRIKEDEYDDE